MKYRRMSQINLNRRFDFRSSHYDINGKIYKIFIYIKVKKKSFSCVLAEVVKTLLSFAASVQVNLLSNFSNLLMFVVLACIEDNETINLFNVYSLNRIKSLFLISFLFMTKWHTKKRSYAIQINHQEFDLGLSSIRQFELEIMGSRSWKSLPI